MKQANRLKVVVFLSSLVLVSIAFWQYRPASAQMTDRTQNPNSATSALRSR